MPDEWVDFALAAYREDGVWQVQELTHDHVEDLDTLASALRRFPGDSGCLGLISIDESYALLVRVNGARTRVLLSDIEAAEEFDLAESVLEHLGLSLLDDDDDPVPAGDLGILEDVGVSILDMGLLVEDDDIFPEELLSTVAHRLGFGDLFDEQVGLDDEDDD